MSRKLMVLGLAAVLVIAVAIPVVAQERVVAPKLEKISKRALKNSRLALRKAKAANRQAQAANAAATNVVSTATAAKEQAANASASAADARTIAERTRAALDATTVRSAWVGADAPTSSPTFVTLPDGPSVSAEVPASGLIEVWAQATVEGEGAVSLYEDGKPQEGQAEICSPEEDAGVLFSVGVEAGEPVTIATPASGALGLCGTLGAPAPVLFQTTPGWHTYELRYASCGCEDPAESVVFSDRRLFVAPRP